MAHCIPIFVLILHVVASTLRSLRFLLFKTTVLLEVYGHSQSPLHILRGLGDNRVGRECRF